MEMTDITPGSPWKGSMLLIDEVDGLVVIHEKDGGTTIKEIGPDSDGDGVTDAQDLIDRFLERSTRPGIPI